ncbi:MAG: hypothetical protein M3Q85_03065, partial [Acidobacteriota bacterium]|nr:hypothetical protein [Acidobacteriota bacterium]
MMRTPPALVLAVTSIAVTASAYQASQSWPPAVVKIAAVSRPLSPAEALTTFALPPGFRMELVAAEPLVQDPIMIEWDPA